MSEEDKYISNAAAGDDEGGEYPTKQVAVKDVDDALRFLDGEGGGPEAAAAMSETDQRNFLRRIDMRIIPLMLACYMLEYLDKTLREQIPLSTIIIRHTTNWANFISPRDGSLPPR
jgi:hypothetical protein